jgi:peptidoglycan/LPS O-acetylase OafA/YrhL
MLVLHKLSPAQVGTHLLSSLTYTHNLVHGEASLINGVAWSLEVECQFYLVAPLLANIFRFRPAPTRRLLLVVAIALSACASEYLIPQTPRWRLSLPSHLSFFFCGFLLADLFAAELLSGPRRHASRTYSWDAVGVLAWLTLLALLVGPASLRILLPLPILLAYCAAFRGRSSGKFFANRYIFTIGGMCYTIYLYHEFIISFFGGVFVRLPGLKTLPTWTSLSLASLVLAPIVLVICSVLFALTEKPFMYSNWPALVRARWAGRSHERQVRAPRGSGAP